eukprot:1190547-Prorocentrum_minimum.AAC.3
MAGDTCGTAAAGCSEKRKSTDSEMPARYSGSSSAASAACLERCACQYHTKKWAWVNSQSESHRTHGCKSHPSSPIRTRLAAMLSAYLKHTHPTPLSHSSPPRRVEDAHLLGCVGLGKLKSWCRGDYSERHACESRSHKIGL